MHVMISEHISDKEDMVLVCGSCLEETNVV